MSKEDKKQGKIWPRQPNLPLNKHGNFVNFLLSFLREFLRKVDELRGIICVQHNSNI